MSINTSLYLKKYAFRPPQSRANTKKTGENGEIGDEFENWKKIGARFGKKEAFAKLLII